MKANVLVIGSGAREDAFAWKLAQSPQVSKVFVVPGNGGTTKRFGQSPNIQPYELEKLAAFAEEKDIDFTVVGPEGPLIAGIGNSFVGPHSRMFKVFGPQAGAARLEASKWEAKRVMHKLGIPTADYSLFQSWDEARNFVATAAPPYVFKVDWPALGKGVYVCRDQNEALEAIYQIYEMNVHGGGNGIVIAERFLEGREVSIHAVCDGNRAILLPASQDHKCLLDGNHGPNTGGMGAFAPVPWFTSAHEAEVLKRIVDPIGRNMLYTGILYPGLMLTKDGFKVLEINVRGGDPETEVLAMLLKSDLFDLFYKASWGVLDTASAPEWHPGFAVCVVLASKEYPGKCTTGHLITGIEEAERLPDVCVFHAGTRYDGGKFYTAGGRVLAVTARAETLAEARNRAYTAVSCINFDGMQFRSDIAQDA